MNCEKREGMYYFSSRKAAKPQRKTIKNKKAQTIRIVPFVKIQEILD
jgi:hypothetical protein